MRNRSKIVVSMIVTLSASTLLALSPAVAGGWNRANNPNRIAAETGFDFEFQFDKLPTEASLKNKPWPDSYWPTYQRGLAYRWQGALKPVKHKDETEEEFNVRKSKDRFFTEKEVLFMSEEERNKLSPAEKYDILRGDYDYTLTRSELDRTDEKAPKWEGICHGWAAAAMHYDTPESCKVGLGTPFTFNRPMMPFASSDVKALLSLMHGNYNENDDTYFAGTRCNDKREDVPDWDKSHHHNDINAGAFHLILVNRIGKLDKGFVFDRTVDQEVWNQPVEGYKMKVVKEQAPDPKEAAPGTVKEVVVDMVVKYTVESEPHVEKMAEEERKHYVVDQPYQYILELDKDNKVIGGRWISDSYPDFVWSNGKAEFNGLFKDLGKLYKKSTRKKDLLSRIGDLISFE